MNLKMAFFLKWVEDECSETLTSTAFATLAAAVGCAGYMLRYFQRKPTSIWIEAADGRPVMLEPAIAIRRAFDAPNSG
jgi:hypothetical protein